MTATDLMRLADDGGRVAEHAPWPDPNCPDCWGVGEYYTHADDCRDRLCALAGGVHDCAGEVVECDCHLDAESYFLQRRLADWQVMATIVKSAVPGGRSDGQPGGA